MDAADLRVFEAVARLGGMNRAAAELNTVQSNVTTRIRRLEDELGTPLFDRHSRGVTPTPAGLRLLPHAERIGELLATARRAAADDGRPKGPLTVGSLETTAALRLSPVLTAYVAAWPEVDLMLRTGTTAELIEATLDRTVEGAFVAGPVDHPDLDHSVMFVEDLAIATAPGVTSLDELARFEALKLVVLRAGCSYRQRLEAILARRGVVGLRQLEFGTIDAIVSCVSAGLGVTLLPVGILQSAQDAGRLIMHTLPAAEATAETLFIRRRDAFLSSAMRAFLEAARLPQPTRLAS
ncbi:MAG: LysR family transcriptional regulator [Alphaproteobacteria bacterium]|nr:LysR family transcriptional regulator [Alphaproteobacteria bacterium]